MQKRQEKNELPIAEQAESCSAAAPDAEPGQAKEIGGRDGPDPTRYGDWEKAGRCIDF